MGNQRVSIRPSLRVTLDEGAGLVIERILPSEARVKMALQADEWQEIADWVRCVRMLSGGSKGDG